MIFLGNFWIGTMQNNIADDGSDIEITKNSGSLYCIDEDLNITNHENDIGISSEHKTLCGRCVEIMARI